MSAPSTRKLAFGAIGITAAAVAGLTIFVLTAQHSPTAPSDGVTVVLTDSGCLSDRFSVPAGKVRFTIRNDSRRSQEWEIIQGVMVIEERENILPGHTQNMTVPLEPGEYDVTCSPQSKFTPELRGKLTVLAAADGAAPAVLPKPSELIGAMAEYRFFLREESGELRQQTQTFVEAVKAGNFDQARRLYAPAHLHYGRIKPVAALFSDLDERIDSHAEDHAQKEADPGFTGFHRLGYGLFAPNTPQGLGDLADQLMADVITLEERLKSLTVPPEKMAAGAALLLDKIAATTIFGAEERFSHTDLWTLKANIEGVQKIAALLRPMLIKADKPLQDRIDANLAAVDAILARQTLQDGGFPADDKMTEADRATLRTPITALAEDLSKIRSSLGLNE